MKDFAVYGNINHKIFFIEPYELFHFIFILDSYPYMDKYLFLHIKPEKAKFMMTYFRWINSRRTR